MPEKNGREIFHWFENRGKERPKRGIKDLVRKVGGRSTFFKWTYHKLELQTLHNCG